MKNECNIVRDLLPLYIENMTSPESAQFVEAHLSKCPECNELYTSMTDMGEEKINDEEAEKKILPLRIVKRKLRCKKIATYVIAGVLSLAILLGAATFAYNFIDKQNKNAQIEYGESQWFSMADRKAAIEYVLNEIYDMDFGYDIISVSFAGDARCLQAYLKATDREYLEGEPIVWRGNYDYMVISVDLKTPAWADGEVFKPNTYYEGIEWVLKRTDGYPGWDTDYITLPNTAPNAIPAE